MIRVDSVVLLVRNRLVFHDELIIKEQFQLICRLVTIMHSETETNSRMVISPPVVIMRDILFQFLNAFKLLQYEINVSQAHVFSGSRNPLHFLERIFIFFVPLLLLCFRSSLFFFTFSFCFEFFHDCHEIFVIFYQFEHAFLVVIEFF